MTNTVDGHGSWNNGRKGRGNWELGPGYFTEPKFCIGNSISFKGIVHNFFVYRSNLVFWIVMGCGIADFVRRGL